MEQKNTSGPRAKRAAPLIELSVTRGSGWFAVFYGGEMPQRVSLPLPFSSAAMFEEVRAAMFARFPGSKVERQ